MSDKVFSIINVNITERVKTKISMTSYKINSRETRSLQKVEKMQNPVHLCLMLLIIWSTYCYLPHHQSWCSYMTNTCIFNMYCQ